MLEFKIRPEAACDLLSPGLAAGSRVPHQALQRPVSAAGQAGAVLDVNLGWGTKEPW